MLDLSDSPGVLLVRAQPQRVPSMDPRKVARNNVLCQRRMRRRFCFRHPVRVNFCFHHMCLHPKCSDFLGDFKNAQSHFLLLLGPCSLPGHKVTSTPAKEASSAQEYR